MAMRTIDLRNTKCPMNLVKAKLELDKIRKRDRLEVIFDILKIIRDHQNSIKPTPLLRYSNLSCASSFIILSLRP